MQTVVVTSRNPVKVNATKDAFSKMFPEEEFNFVSVEASSGVSDQPMSDQETLTGAINRADNAKSHNPGYSYYVGIEGGLEDIDGELLIIAWIVVEKDGHYSKIRTSSFFLPPAVRTLIHEGKELGDADDIVFGIQNSKQANGAIGILTGDIVTRGSFYFQALVMALVPYKNSHLYFS
jgi:inosine/xanthosine triphosphatase